MQNIYPVRKVGVGVQGLLEFGLGKNSDLKKRVFITRSGSKYKVKTRRLEFVKYMKDEKITLASLEKIFNKE